MAKDNWEDITTYSRGDTDPRPAIFQLQLGKYFRLVLCYSHIYFPNEWVCSLYGGFEHAQLHMKKYEDLPKAKLAAVKLAKRVLDPAVAVLNKELKGGRNVSKTR